MLCWNSNWSLVVLQQNLMLTKNIAQVIWRGNGTRNANNCASSAQHEWHAGHSEPCVQQALCTFIPGPNTWALNDLCGADWSAVCQSIWHQVVLTMGCKSGCSLWNEVVCCWTCRWWWHHGSASGPTMVVSVWHLVYLLYRGPGPASSSGTHSALTNFTFSLLQPLAGESGRQQHVVWTVFTGKVNQVRPVVFKKPVTWTLEKGSVARFHMICLAEFPLTLVTCLFSTGWFLGQVEQYLNRPTNLKLFHWINFNLRANKKWTKNRDGQVARKILGGKLLIEEMFSNNLFFFFDAFPFQVKNLFASRLSP